MAKSWGAGAGFKRPKTERTAYSEASAVTSVRPSLALWKGGVFVPEVRSNLVDLIDPTTFKIVDQFRCGPKPQHVIPSCDLKTLWVARSGRRPGSRQTWSHN